MNIKNYLKYIILLICISILVNCISCASDQNTDKAYTTAIQKWQQNRIEQLKSKKGWLNLAGLYWLKDGDNSFGSDPANDIVFPDGKAAHFIGSFVLNNGEVNISINKGIQVAHNGEPILKMRMRIDQEDKPTILTHETLSWFIIKRDGKLAVRLRDFESPQLKQFKGIETYSIDPTWKVEAILKPDEVRKKIPISTVLGTTRNQTSPGTLVFKIQGKTYTLDAVAEETDKKLFVIFADKTTGVETYGGGRFLFVDKPAKDGKTIIDFNQAHNPPCAFSAFATCPLPPRQNRLPIKITAGEKLYLGEH